MKKLQFIFLFFLCLITINLKTFAQDSLLQERLQSVGKAISFIGLSKGEIKSYLNNVGFRFSEQSQNGDMFKYNKQTSNSAYEITFAVNKNKVSALQWYEHLSILQRDLSEITQMGFKGDVVNNDEGIYSYKNYSRNLLISILVHSGEYNFTITIGKINSDMAIVKSKNSYPNRTVNPNYTPKYSIKNINKGGPGANYIVVSPRAYFYDLSVNGEFKRKAYLVYGERISALKVKNGYMYCEFINSATKKTSKGWILQSDLDKTVSDEGTDAKKIRNHNFEELVKFNGKRIQKNNMTSTNFFSNPLIEKELGRIFGNDYEGFWVEAINPHLEGNIVIKNNTLFLYEYNKSADPKISYDIFLFIDLQEKQTFLYSNYNVVYNGDVAEKNYGDTPPSENIRNFIKNQLINYVSEDKVSALNDKITNGE